MLLINHSIPVSRPTALKEGAEPLRGEEEASEDAIKERLESGLVSHVQDYSDEEDSQGIVKETYVSSLKHV